jgi:hypothetical protein
MLWYLRVVQRRGRNDSIPRVCPAWSTTATITSARAGPTEEEVLGGREA